MPGLYADERGKLSKASDDKSRGEDRGPGQTHPPSSGNAPPPEAEGKDLGRRDKDAYN